MLIGDEVGGLLNRRAVHGETVPRGTVVELRPILAPPPDDKISVPGLKDGGAHGRAEARLYLAGTGSYDKVVLIPQGMDFNEQNPELRLTPDQLWFQFDQFLTGLYQYGYSVWLFRPYKTGENIHEQAAEFAGAKGVLIPAKPVDGPSLVHAADLVVSAGGTMNREAALLGVPTWTTFAGELGGVDRMLIEEGRMQVLSAPSELTIAKRAPGMTAYAGLADEVTAEILRR